MKNILYVFLRDLKASSRDFLGAYLLVMPILVAIAINLFVPGINDSSVRLGFIKSDGSEIAKYYKDYAKVEVFDNLEDLQERILKRDDLIGIAKVNEEFKLLAQGNENESSMEAAKLFKTYYDLDIDIGESTATIESYRRNVPPLKKGWTNLSLLMISVMGGMLIGLSIVEEKIDNTISAINVTPMSRLSYIIGKSISGILVSLVGSILIITITGFGASNLLQVSLLILSICFISVMIGFYEGISNDDAMDAVGNVKILFLPLYGSIAAFEFLGDKWQPLFYWVPFYWAYKGNDAVLEGVAEWGDVLLYSSIIIIISLLVYVLLSPRIKKGLK